MQQPGYRQQPRDRAPSGVRARLEHTAPSRPPAPSLPRAQRAMERADEMLAQAEARLRRVARLWEAHPRLVITERRADGQAVFEAAEPGLPARTYPGMDALLDDLVRDEPPS